jgi:hypothetical protein
MEKPIRSEFSVHVLSPVGLEKARDIARGFSILLNDLEELCGRDGREMALVRTHLQEAAFFAKRAMAVLPENQNYKLTADEIAALESTRAT